ncbi:hypothetical protein MVEN_02154000 [Mycena venus]|uniref:CxC1-like cysteine cluster associated with KDZ transposases domain-containing protein n=1 Tax=Mycena venus TaxID=2733690 RepID=A0A8H6XAW7_9AGAR|nr:hypothetical protein MVEN_02154000 [Mycena venus]
MAGLFCVLVSRPMGCRQAQRVLPIRSSLNAAKICLAKAEDACKQAERLQNMSQEERRDHDLLRGNFSAPYDDDDGWEEGVLHGRTTAHISHAGEAPPEDPERADADLFYGIRQNHRKVWGRRRYPNLRTRRNCTQLQIDGFARQIERMTDAYLDFGVAVAEEDGIPAYSEVPGAAGVQETRKIFVVDVFSACHKELRLVAGDAYIASACVRWGWMPVSPWTPTAVITIRALEMYRITHLRCPRLEIQAFVRALCDIHGIAPRQWLGAQFSVAFDVYLVIQAVVDKRVQVVLGRDAPDWHLKNTCSCCLYKLEGEPCLKIPFMGTFDGNNSLSRYDRRERVEDEDGICAPGVSKERLDDRIVPGDYYSMREEADNWVKEGVEDLMKSFYMDTEDGEGNEDSCSERWQNMKEEVMSRVYGMYDETGFFPALCRHGFVLEVVVDMVKSGELEKYPLAIIAHILNILGEIAIGYDISCKFGKMVEVHPTLKDLARDKNFRALVGTFHGHGHNRLCGLDNLMPYVEGVGLKALEICESFFSKVERARHHNSLRQPIPSPTSNNDLPKARQHLRHLSRPHLTAVQQVSMRAGDQEDVRRELSVQSRDEFETWREREKAHLRTLLKEPEEETLKMEDRVTAILGVEAPFIPAKTDAGYAEAAKATRHVETQRQHALEVEARARAAVHDLELRLAVTTRWVPGDEKWATVLAMMNKHRYLRALDHLQGLIILWMSELAKCNMSGTGSKLRKHIAKALQARSKVVKNAIAKYNEIAEAMTPPKPTLDWEEVVETFGGEPWAQPAGQAAMDQHFKLLHAEEEIVRLNVEICRLVTFMKDEEAFLSHEERRLQAEGKEGLAIQVGLVRMERGRFTDLHMLRLVKLSKDPGFTGNILPGVSINCERHAPVARDNDADMRAPSLLPSLEEDPESPADDDEADVESKDKDGMMAEAFMNIIRISQDNGADAEDK